MPNIAKLGIKATVSAAGVTSGLRSANKSFNQFEKSTSAKMSGLGKNIAASFVSMTAKITILALALKRVMTSVLSEFRRLDEVRKFALSIGQAGQGGTQALLALEYAGERVGVSFEKTRDGLRKLSKAVGEAQMGFGEGARAFEILGLDAEKMGRMTPIQQFIKAKDAIQKLGNSALRTAAANKVFSEGGIKMLNLLRLQSHELEALMKRHDRLAGTLTEQQIAGVEGVNDALGDLKLAYSGLQRQGFANMAQPLFVMLRTTADFFATLRDGTTQWATVLREGVLASFQKTLQILPGMVTLFGGMAQGAFKLAAALAFSLNAVTEMFQRMASGIGIIDEGAEANRTFGQTFSDGLAMVGSIFANIGTWIRGIGAGLLAINIAVAQTLGEGMSAAVRSVLMIFEIVSRKAVSFFRMMADGARGAGASPIVAETLDAIAGLAEQGAGRAGAWEKKWTDGFAKINKGADGLRKALAEIAVDELGKGLEASVAAGEKNARTRLKITEGWAKNTKDFLDLLKNAGNVKPVEGAFAAPGGGDAAKTKFAGAFEFGSVEAYSAGLTSRAQETSELIQINTKTANEQLAQLNNKVDRLRTSQEEREQNKELGLTRGN